VRGVPTFDERPVPTPARSKNWSATITGKLFAHWSTAFANSKQSRAIKKFSTKLSERQKAPGR